MGRTIPTANQANNRTIHELRVVRDGLTTEDKKLWDQFMATGHLNERAISLAVWYDPFDAMVLGMLFAQYKMIRKLGGNITVWQDVTLDGETLTSEIPPAAGADSGS